tara:strand:+ start:341 stop:580 length:240 start_codon:yes stop_codon:yes gene_type:complete
MFEVQHYTFVDGWVNTYTVTDDNGENPISVVFDTHAEAQADIDSYMGEIDDQIKSGERAADEGYDSDEFRVVEILEKIS